jgi:methionyl-tRNA formyltransferase
MRIAIFGFSQIAADVARLITEMGHELCAVFTHEPDLHEDLIFHKLKDLQCPTYVVPSHVTIDDSWAIELEKAEPDLILSVSFRSLLPQAILDVPTHGAINFHNSLLPEYRGRSPINWQLINGERKSGVTAHWIDSGIDTGQIIWQNAIIINLSMTAPELLQECNRLILYQAARIIRIIERGDPLPSRPQTRPHTPYCRGRTPEDGKLSFNVSARSIHNKVRALTRPYPGAFFERNGARIYLWKTRTLPGNTVTPGDIYFPDEDKLAIGTASGSVEVLEWSLKDGKTRSGPELLNYW